MIFRETKLKNAFIIEPELLSDNRGFFSRLWCSQTFEKYGVAIPMLQCNMSFSHNKGTLRGLHYQATPHQEAKLVRCTKGIAYDVIIDLRNNSTTYKQYFGIELSPENHLMLYVPKGFAHGYLTLVDNTEVYYHTSEFYYPESEKGIRWDDPSFNIKWPVAIETISEKDKKHPDFLL